MRSRGGGRGSGMNKGGRIGVGAGPGGECICFSCGYRIPHQIGVPCYQQVCPECGTNMMRSN